VSARPGGKERLREQPLYAPRFKYRRGDGNNTFRLGKHQKSPISSLAPFATNLAAKQNQANNRQYQVSKLALLSLVLKMPSKTANSAGSEKTDTRGRK